RRLARPHGVGLPPRNPADAQSAEPDGPPPAAPDAAWRRPVQPFRAGGGAVRPVAAAAIRRLRRGGDDFPPAAADLGGKLRVAQLADHRARAVGPAGRLAGGGDAARATGGTRAPPAAMGYLVSMSGVLDDL